MPNVTIPLTSQTQTLTGDNGLTTDVTFTANDLEAGFWSQTNAVGLRGRNYEPSGDAALVTEFSNSVQDVQFTLFDVDQRSGSWDDQVRVEAFDAAGNPVIINFTTNGTGHVVEEDGAIGDLQIEASNDQGDNQSSIVVTIPGPVAEVRIYYEDGTNTTNDNGLINIQDLSFTNVQPLDGTVSGTAGDDLIDGSYTGDPDNDRVDNNDAILPGDTGNDDLIIAGAGNDSVLAGAGDDEVYGGSGSDTIDGGANDDLLVGDQTNDPAGGGDDTITGGSGNDTIYGDNFGDVGATGSTTTFSWAAQGIGDGVDVSDGLSGTTANGDVTVNLSVVEEVNFTHAQMDTVDPLFNYNGVSDTSSISLQGGSVGTGRDASQATIEFEANDPGLYDEVENVTFGIFDLDEFSGQFLDQVIIRAYDADGNLVPVTMTPGDASTITTVTNPDGSSTATSIGGSGGAGNTDSASGFLRVDIAGPVQRIVIDYNNADPDFGNHAIRIGDLTMDSIAIDDAVGGGNDSLEGGLGDDTIFAQTGSDTIGVSDSFGNDVIFGGEDAGNGDVDVLNGDGLTEDVVVTMTGPEAGTITNGTDTATFSEIEEVRTGSGTDTITLGSGDDSVFAGSGNDEVIISDDFASDDSMDGGDGIDTLTLTPNDDRNLSVDMTTGVVSDGQAGAQEFIRFENITTGGGDDTITGDGVDNVLTSGDGDDSVDGGAGNDTLFGGAGADTLTGGTGDDSISGGTGDDTISLTGTFGNDTIAGGEDAGNGDTDVLDSSAVGTNTTVDFSGPEAGTLSTGGNTATFSEIEQIVTGAGDDTVLGDSGNENVSTGDGADTISGGGGNDTFDAGAGDDTIDGGTGDDSINAGTGSDTIELTNGFGNDTVVAGEDPGDTETDVLDASGVTTDITLDITAPEDGTLSSGGDTVTFSDVEEFVLGSGDDSVTGSTGDDVVDLGQGADTINAGGGDDTINLGEDSPGVPDQDPDVVVLEDGSGNDTVTNFDAPIDNGDGTFTGIDKLDVSALTDLGGVPVNTNDVTVGDDGSGNALLSFPNGETIVLEGISPVDADNPFYLSAIGIPMPDGIVSGTEGADTINAGYTGDPDGDLVDAGDELVAGEGTDDDIIVAMGGDDSIAAGAGNDEVFGGDGADSIDAGAGNDTIYGDTPDGAWYFELYGIPAGTDASNLEEAGFINSTPDYNGVPEDYGYTDNLDPNLIDTGDEFALKFSAIVEIDTAGNYTFGTTSNDGSKLFIDGVEIVNNDGEHPPTTVNGTPVALTAGEHLIEIIYFENVGTTALSATISGTDTGNVATDLATYDGLRDATGNDTIAAGAGDDTIFGGGGDDTILVDEADNTDTITGGEDTGGTDVDTVSFDPVSTADGVDVTFTGDEAADYQVGTTGSDGSFTEIERVVGTDNADTVDLSGDSAGITVEAGAGDDTVNSGQGDDTILTGTGDDLITIDQADGTDTITGGEDGSGTDVDTVSFGDVSNAEGVNVAFTGDETANYQVGTTGSDGSFAEIERVEGTDNADVVDLSGDSAGITVESGAGDDTLTSGQGDDTLLSGTGDDLINIDQADGTDTITGGEDGSGTDVDTVSFDDVTSTESVVVTFTGDEEASYQVGTTGSDGTFAEIERVVGTDNSDTINLSGDSAGITVEAGAGNDAITSGQGDDTIFGGAGNDITNIDEADGTDTITGGEDGSGTDIDTVNFGDVGTTDGVTVTFTGDETATYQVGTTGSDGTFTEIERVFGTANDDTVDLSGDSDGITVVAGVGDDTVISGQGDDSVLGADGDDIFVVDQADGTDTFTGGEDADGNDIDTLSFADVTNTDGVNVSFSGDEAGTYQVGTTGSDGGFAEVERIVGTDNADVVDLTGDTAGITVESGAGDDVITSGDGGDSIIAGTGQDDIIINDDYGRTDVDGGSGADGTGDVLDGSGLTQDVTVDFSAAESGQVTNGTDTLRFAEIEVVETGSGDDIILGDVGNDSVSTGAGVDTISGGAGDDSFDAGAGADTIAGGIGDDSITAGTGDDTIVVEDTFGNDQIDGGSDVGDGDTDVLDGSALTEDVTVNLSAPETGTITNGVDTASFSEIEEIVTGSGDDTVTGGAGSDTVSTGAGADTVTFSGGDDINTGDNDDLLVLTGDETGDITIDGGDEDRDGLGDLTGTGDTLQLGTFADLSTLNTTTAPDGSLSGTVTLDNGSILTFTDIERIICFTPGTTIATPQGARAIETLKVGDLVVTRDHGLQPIRWIESRTVAAKGEFAPVRIRPGAVTGLERDLLVSPQHRMLFTGYRAELLFGEREVLMPAVHLIDGTHVTRETGGEVTYIHMMFDQHEVIFADGAASESFHPGDQALAGITDHAREELFALFPELRSNPMGYGSTARRCLKKHETQMLQAV